MRIPSIHFLYKNAKASLVRFPLTILSSLIAVVVGIYLIEKEGNVKNIFPYINVLLTTGIGIPLYFCASIVSQKKQIKGKGNLFLFLGATLLLVLIFLSLPTAESTHNTSLPYIKYSIYNVIVHLLVSFIPFVFGGQINGFWNYNKALFTRLWTAVFYSGILYIGLALALLSMKLLFEIHFQEKLYFEIFVVIAGLFNTWFFVSGIPEDFAALDEIVEYPKGLKIFSQYILLPLLILYFVILYMYSGKILLSWDWPKGIVSYLIICVSVLGILTFLLLYPFGKSTENSWINKMTKGFYVLMLPLLGVLFIAILMRMDDYGITVKRYVVLALGIWLSTVCLFMLIAKSNIKFIPTSLAIMLIVISFGPWGIFSVSERAQVNRLKKILEHAKILKDDKIVNENIWKKATNGNYEVAVYPNDLLLNDSLHNEVKSILDYLDDNHGFSSIRGWFNQSIYSIVDTQVSKEKTNYIDEAEYYMKSMGLEYETRYEATSGIETSFYVAGNENFFKVTDYDYVVSFDQYIYTESVKVIVIDTFSIAAAKYKFSYKKGKSNQFVFVADKQDFVCNLDMLLNNLNQQYQNQVNNDVPSSAMELIGSTTFFDYTIRFSSIRADKEAEKIDPSYFKGTILIRMKK